MRKLARRIRNERKTACTRQPIVRVTVTKDGKINREEVQWR